MKKLTLTFLFLALTFTGYCQTAPSFNFDFEKAKKGFPTTWNDAAGKDNSISLDSVTVKTGKYAGLIELKEDSKRDYDLWSMALPINYQGKKITLSGYIKTENVRDGFAGLWMRIDPGIAF